MGGLAQQAPPGPQHQDGGDDRDHRVRAGPSPAQDHQARDDRPERPDGIRGQVHERGPHGQALALSAVDHDRTAGIDHQAQGRDHGQSRTLDRHRLSQSRDALDEDPHPRPQQQQGADLGRQDLRARKTEAVAGRGRAGRQHQGAHGDSQTGDIGDQVGGVGEQRQRREHDPPDHLGDQQGDVHSQRPAQCPALTGAGEVPAVLVRMCAPSGRRRGHEPRVGARRPTTRRRVAQVHQEASGPGRASGQHSTAPCHGPVHQTTGGARMSRTWAAVGTRPESTTRSSTTRAGVRMTP